MIYRWERDEESHDHDGAMVLRTDDDRSQEDAYVALYWHDGPWSWMTRGLICTGWESTADAARNACELAVLHGDER